MRSLRRSLCLPIALAWLLSGAALAQPALPFDTFAQFTDSLAVLGALPALRLTAYPNPARDRVSFRFALDRPASPTVRCYDLLGRLSATLGGQALAAGLHVRSLDAEALGAAGTYLCRLQVGADVASVPVTLVR